MEGEISNIRQTIAEFKRDLKTPKSESSKIKLLIQQGEQKIEEYRFLILCFKSVADILKVDIRRNYMVWKGNLLGTIWSLQK